MQRLFLYKCESHCFADKTAYIWEHKPYKKKVRTNLTENIKGQRRIVPYIQSKSDIKRETAYKFTQRNYKSIEKCPDAYVYSAGELLFSIVNKSKTKASQQKHRRMCKAAPYYFQSSVYKGSKNKDGQYRMFVFCSHYRLISFQAKYYRVYFFFFYGKYTFRWSLVKIPEDIYLWNIFLCFWCREPC